jgi:hypothetical protein
MREDEALIE